MFVRNKTEIISKRASKYPQNLLIYCEGVLLNHQHCHISNLWIDDFGVPLTYFFVDEAIPAFLKEKHVARYDFTGYETPFWGIITPHFYTFCAIKGPPHQRSFILSIKPFYQ